jgi:hypothetical protein
LVCCEVWFVKLLKCNFVKNSKVTSCNWSITKCALCVIVYLF